MTRARSISAFVATAQPRPTRISSFFPDGTVSAPFSQLAAVPSSLSDIIFSPETLVAPINPDTPEWLRSVVWTDFRLAVAFFVVSPLVLLIWSAIQCRPGKPNALAADAVLRIISGYWQASSLLLITVLLNIGTSPIGVVTGAVAQLMIWISLNWWESLNEEAAASELPIGQLFDKWQSITSLVACIGVVVQLPFLQCAVAAPGESMQLLTNPYCSAWLEPPQTAAYLVGIQPSAFLDSVATVALTIYIGYLLYFVAGPLQSIGRSGRAARSTFTFVDGWAWLGFLEQMTSSNQEE